MRKDDLNKPKDWDEAYQDGVDPVAEADKVRATDTSKEPEWLQRIVTAADLQTMKFPEVSYVVPGIIPEGLTLMGGRPKIGKSWMALDLCIGIASGRPVLGDIEPLFGNVLYCALEDTYRRLKQRTTKLLSPFTEDWPEQLALATEWSRLDAGGADDIERWCDSVPEPKLCVLDTLAGIRPSRNSSDTLYEGDYRALAKIHRLANDRGLAILVLTHTRKLDADDPIDTISGSLGLTGCADTILVLNRTGQGTTLYVRGRDVEEHEHAVSFSAETCRWTVLGDAQEVHRSETRSAILSFLKEATELMTPQKIADATNISVNNINQRLHKMVESGEVVRPQRGKYAHPNRLDDIDASTPHKNRNK